MESISKKNSSFRVSIRREQIQSLIKTKRKQMLDRLQCQEECDANYWNLLNYTNLQNLTKMDRETLENHFQMLIEIVSLQDVASYYQQLQPLLSTIVQFFEFSYNSWFKAIHLQEQLLPETQKEQILPLVVMNKMLVFINPNQLTNIIGSIYYEIVPQDFAVLRKSLILMRQILAFTMKDACVLSDFLRRAGEPINLAQSEVNRNSILLVLMNITSAEDDTIMDIVYHQNILQNISEWIQVYGFSEQQKQSICGIYSNMIQYLCNRLPSEGFEPSMQEGPAGEYNLFLPIFQDLVKQQSCFIREKMVYVGAQLLKRSSEQGLQWREYLLQLCEEIIRGIVYNKQYCQAMEDLFIAFIKQNRINGHIAWLLEFLRIALNNYTYAYYGFKEKEKTKLNTTEANQSKPKCLQNISKLINTCESMLVQEPPLSDTHAQTECQQEIVKQLVDFWCKEELQPLQQQFLSFMATALEADEDLSNFCFEQQQICEVLVSLINCSYQFPSEIEMAMRLTSIFLNRVGRMREAERRHFLGQWEGALKDVKYRLQDYTTMIINGSCVKMAEINLSLLNQLLPPEMGCEST